jgi:phosphoadenosine phosphosulfate reductase
MRPERDLKGHALSRAEALNLAYGEARAEEILAGTLAEFPGHVAAVSSFGADSAILLHMIAALDRDLPVLMIDTLMLFEETLAYQRDLADRLGLTNVQHLRPAAADLAALDPDGTLHRRDPDACCVVRKVAPLDRALDRWPVSITGRKRFQTAARARLMPFEADGERIKVSPLAAWSREDLRAYMAAHDLPPHPLLARGFRSIGCRPCTTATAAGEDERAGRWRGSEKTECGLHYGPGGTARRAPERSPSMTERTTVVVTDQGFAPEDWAEGRILPFDMLGSGEGVHEEAIAVDFPNDRDPVDLAPWLDRLALVRVAFPSFNDGRGFSIAARLRAMGYDGRLRAKGPLIADQYPAARRTGFDEVEVPAEIAARQPEAAWRPRPRPDYRDRLARRS